MLILQSRIARVTHNKKNIYKNQHVNLNEKQEFKEAQLTIPVIQSVPFLTLKIATVKYLCNKNSGIIR